MKIKYLFYLPGARITEEPLQFQLCCKVITALYYCIAEKCNVKTVKTQYPQPSTPNYRWPVAAVSHQMWNNPVQLLYNQQFCSTCKGIVLLFSLWMGF